MRKAKYLGHIFVALSLYFIFNSLSSLDLYTISFQDYVTPENLYFLLASFVVFIIALYIGSYLWVYLLQCLSHKIELPTKPLIKIYSKSNLGKYLPGNVMHYVARNVLAKKYLISHKIIALSSFVEVFFVLLSGLFLFVLIAFFAEINISLDSYRQYFSVNYLIALILILFTVLIFLFLYRKRLSLTVANIIKVLPEFSSLVFAFSGYIILYLVLGVSLFFIMVIFDDVGVTFQNYCNILYVFIFSWIIGFVVPGAPGGIGIREAIFILLLSQNYSKEAVVLVALLYRVVNIVGDITFYFLTNGFSKKNT